MGIIIGILTGILVVLCIFLVLIILMQKSKQEAGLGAAFGGAATDQLFGAGTTSVLTKATVWGTAFFFIITLVLAVHYSHLHRQSLTAKVLSADSNAPPALVAGPSTNATAESEKPAPNPSATNSLTGTNAPATK